MVGKAVKANICELVEEVRAGSSLSMIKELTSLVQSVSWSKSFLVRFHYG